MEALDVVVVGAGVVGLAVARALAQQRREVVVLEAEDAIGTVTSSRNSEVIHAGIAYVPGSLKARLCRRGRDLLYSYLEAQRIPHRRCGKLIVATSGDEVQQLRALLENARANDVHDLVWRSAGEVAALEPGLRCQAALESPSSGILDVHGLLASLRQELEDSGGTVVLRAPVASARTTSAGLELSVGGAEPVRAVARVVINAAGLGAQALAARIEGLPPPTIPPLYLGKGNYFVLRGAAPFERLIYPVPGPASLGIHFTRDLGGRGRFGPDLEWVDRIDYSVDLARMADFIAAIRRYWPDLPDQALEPGYAGIRPKLQAPGTPPADFVIQGSAVHGVVGWINLYGIDSPGLTSCLALGEEVARVVGGEHVRQA